MKIVPILLLVCFAFLELGSAGTCPRYPLIRDFDFKQYLGLWHQQDKRQAGWEIPGRCWKSLYMRDPRNGQYKLRMIFENTLTGREEQYVSQISLQGPQRPSVIKYTIPLTFLENEFQVLATDYETFSVEYKCDPNGILGKLESVFLLTRDKNPIPNVLQKAYAIMHRYGIDIRKLERVDQTCGGMISASPHETAYAGVGIESGVPAVSVQGHPSSPIYASPDYDYLATPSQHIFDGHDDYLSEGASEKQEYYESSSPLVLKTRPYYHQPPPRRASEPVFKNRFWRPFNLFG